MWFQSPICSQLKLTADGKWWIEVCKKSKKWQNYLCSHKSLYDNLTICTVCLCIKYSTFCDIVLICINYWKSFIEFYESSIIIIIKTHKIKLLLCTGLLHVKEHNNKTAYVNVVVRASLFLQQGSGFLMSFPFTCSF